ncbi:MAG: PKD domain-containing protein [Bacteroidota bacterium]|nr:PKD domain-containing protein [Bacteroidota bacterium]
MKRILLNSLLFRKGDRRMPASLKKMVFLAIIMIFTSSMLFAQNDVFYILGHVNNETTLEPIEYQLIYIESDSTYDIPDYFYAEVSTNENGFYKVSVPRPQQEVDFFVYTYDCQGQKQDTILKISEGFISPNQKYFVDFDVCEIELLNCEPNFFFVYDSLAQDAGSYHYNFIDASGEGVNNWNWNFGDGTETLGENVSHVYEELGVYEVKLTIQSNDIFGVGCMDSITKLVNVGGFNYYYLAGQVFKPDYFPFEEDINVYLYRVEESGIIPVDTTTVEEVIGQNNEVIYAYAFHFLIEGDYIVKAQVTPNSPLYGEFIPTYYGDAIFWEDAQMIEHHEDNPDYDINIVPSYDYLGGEGHINGNISFFNEFTDNQPAFDVELVLADSLGHYIKYNYSDEKGEFLFKELPHGLYSIQPDLTGFNCEPIEVILDEENPIADNVAIVINGIDTNTSIQENTSEYVDAISQVYPNPVTNIARIDVSLKKASGLEFYVFNQLGQLMKQERTQQAAGEQSVEVNMSSLPVGYYTLQIVTQDRIAFTTKIIKTR